MIRVEIPSPLQAIAGVQGELRFDLAAPVTQRAIIDAIEARFPMLRGTIRDHNSQQRRAFLRFFACAEDISQQSLDTPVPDAVASGTEPFLIVGATAGG